MAQNDVSTAMQKRGVHPVVGVYAPAPERFLQLLREVIPDSQLRVCGEWERIQTILKDSEILLAFKFGTRPFPRDSILRAARLRWVQLASAGVDHMTPFDPFRLTVTNASGVHGNIMAQYVLGALIHVLWDFPRLVRQQRERIWERYEVPDLGGKTMGVVGVGHVGATVGRRAAMFGMKLLGTRRSGQPVEGFDRIYPPENLAEVLSRSDVVVLTLPRTRDTMGMIGEKQIAQMKPSAYLVNVSRGGIVDERALVAALKRKTIAGAVLDVFEQEPLPPTSELWSLPNVFVTPHISSELEDWPLEVARLFLDNLDRWIHGKSMVNVVDPALEY